MTFNNQATFCIGTGRWGLGLHKEYQEQLALVQEEIEFQYIRGHGLFSDDMAIFQKSEIDGKVRVEYNFTYVDRVMDEYLSKGLRPFVELGFMPKKLASGEATIFYWKANVTPPMDYKMWCDLVKATLNHWVDRYGIEEVLLWPFEVWNEPNLKDFWCVAEEKGVDPLTEYCKLYHVTAQAVKEVDERFRVGGPAICGVDDERWLRMFLEYCKDQKAPLDFVTRHAYGANGPERKGHYLYQELREPQVMLQELQISRDIIDSFEEFKDMELHITEYNTSYSPICPIHDTNLNAAYIGRLLASMGDTCASYSYWTFGDVFEEWGVPFTPFHGGFGLVANGMIRKPTYYTFEFFAKLFQEGVERTDDYILTKKDDKYRGVAYFPVINHEKEATKSVMVSVGLKQGEYRIIRKTVDEITTNPLKAWYDIGSPANPSKQQLDEIKAMSLPHVAIERISVTEDKNTWISIDLKRNAVVYFDIEPIEIQQDWGYDPDLIDGLNR